jgi:hypothetical protein
MNGAMMRTEFMSEAASTYKREGAFRARLLHAKVMTCFLSKSCYGERRTRMTAAFTPFHKLSAVLLLLITFFKLVNLPFSFPQGFFQSMLVAMMDPLRE